MLRRVPIIKIVEFAGINSRQTLLGWCGSLVRLWGFPTLGVPYWGPYSPYSEGILLFGSYWIFARACDLLTSPAMASP